MATLVLGAVGKAAGAALGAVGAAIGGAIGTAVGSIVDSWLVAQIAPPPVSEGPRLESLRVTSSAEGGAIPRVYGRMRIGGTVIWATDFREERRERSERVSKTQRVQTVEYVYSASFAVALCEGPVAGIGRIWADGEPLDLREVVWRLHRGTEDQAPDPLILALMGPEATPAYRGTAYVVFEDLELSAFGNRLPQLSFEVFRPLAEPDTAEGALRAVTLIPGAGEIVYAADTVRAGETGRTRGWTRRVQPSANQGPALNEHAVPGTPDLLVALDRLQASAPGVESVSLVVSWFGDDLRAGHCRIRPLVEASDRVTVPEWRVNGLDRAAAAVTSSVGGRPAYGGTPADHTVVSAIRELRARGLRVTFYPFIMMDVPPGNARPNPYSDNAASAGQPAYPWRGRITCSPAPGFAGSPDGTPAAAAQVAAFFGGASAADFAVDGEDVSWTGDPDDWGLRRMILHYAHLCAAAGGVDAFLIGSELRGLTTVRDGASSYPAVQALRALAADVRAILGPGTRISYAADWSEYFGHRPADGSGDVHFHLDPLWADPEIDFVGIDNYMPLSDWRDGFDHLDAQAGWPAVHERGYLMANVAGGEGYDWFYASEADRAAQRRTAIADGYPVSFDRAVPRPLALPAVIGPTGLVVNAVHEEVGRGGYFHPDSATSEGQFTMMLACALAARALDATHPDAAAGYRSRSLLLAAPLEHAFYRQPLTDDPAKTFLPHWLSVGRGQVELQRVVLDRLVEFVEVSPGVLRGVIPPEAHGDVLRLVYSVRAEDATLLWENPYSPVVGTQYALAAPPVVTAAGAEIHITAPGPSLRARVVYSHDRGDVLEAGAPYEAWPTWRRLEATEIACAGDSLRWSILAFRAMAAAHGDPRWAGLAEVMRANAVRAFDVDDARFIFRPMFSADGIVHGTYSYETRATRWYREAATGFIRADITSGPGESQIGRAVGFTVPAGDAIEATLGTTVASDQVWLYIDTAVSYSPATRYAAQLSMSGTGLQDFSVPLGDFRRLSDNAPLGGPVTVVNFGVIDRIAAAHSITIRVVRPAQRSPHPYVPWIVPFTTNLLNGEVVTWRGLPGSGYQAPDVWHEIGGPDAPTGMLTQAQFLQDAQDAWEADVGFRGPFAHAFVWDRPEADDVGGPPVGSWIYTWHDPNSFWGGYQYRALEGTARALHVADGEAPFAAARAKCLAAVEDFLSWLDGAWTAGDPPPTTYRDSGVSTDYDEPHMAALLLRACVYCLSSTEWCAAPARVALAQAIADRAWSYMETRWVATGAYGGTWEGGGGVYYGFWHAEILCTLSEMLLVPGWGAVAGAAPELIRSRIVAAGEWLESRTAATHAVEHGESWIFRVKDLRRWWGSFHFDRPGGVRASEPTAWQPESKPIVFTELGCPAVDRGTNQPNVFHDPKSSESFLPYFSRGWRDDAIQRAYLDATALFWNDPANNPVSSVYEGRMVQWRDCAAWTWDARPWPWFPGLADVWADAPNWTLGHWLTGRLGAASLAALVRELCRRAGLPEARIDVSGLWGQVEGFVVAGLEAPRATIGQLARLFGFDAVESGGVLRFTMRGRGPAATLALSGEPEDGVLEPVAAGDREPFERVRAQESELPASLTWTVARADDDRYDGVAVAARRLVAEHAREAAEAFPAVLPPEAAERLCAAALAEDWTARETLALALPPSALALDPGDVLEVADGPRRQHYRLVTVADGEARRVEAVRQDREDRDAPLGAARAARLARPALLSAPEVTLLDLPWIREDRPAHQPLVAAVASPWPGTLAVWRAEGGGWRALSTTGLRARAGRLVEPLPPAERSGLIDRWTTAVVELDHGLLASAPWSEVLGGANLLAVGAGGDWELLQFRDATLVAPRRWRIGGLLRGQRGTEWAARAGHAAGAAVVVLDDGLDALPFALGDVGVTQRLRIGPAALPVTEPVYTEGELVPRAVGLVPLAPVHVRLARLAGGDLRLSWTRRDRAPAADGWELAEVPLSESQERYLVEVLDGETVVRRVETSAPHWIYVAAQQTADWGAPVEEIEVRIAQQGLFRWGYPLRATVRVGRVEG